MQSLDMTPTWAGLLPALVAILKDGTGEGPAIAQAELARLCAFADSAIAEQKAAKANPPRYTEELAAQRGRGLAADSLAGFARDFMTQGAFIRAACYWEAAARVAPAEMEAARDFRVSADLAEREAAALLSSHAAGLRQEAAGAAREALDMAQSCLAAYPAVDLDSPKGSREIRRAAIDLRDCLADLVVALSSSPSI